MQPLIEMVKAMPPAQPQPPVEEQPTYLLELSSLTLEIKPSAKIPNLVPVLDRPRPAVLR